MNLQEFKAWFDGFTESMEDNLPGPRAWARICEKVKSIEDSPPTTETVFIHDYYRPWRRWFESPAWWYSQAGDCLPQFTAQMSVADSGSAYEGDSARVFNSSVAFHNLGSAEAASLKGGTAD